jgi:hypothetical protein
MAKYNDMNWQGGQTNLPGLRKKIYYASLSVIKKWPVLLDSEDPIINSTYTGSFEFETAAVFTSIDVIQRKNGLDSTPQGEKESTTVVNKLSVKHPGTGEEAVSFQKKANRDNLIFIVQDMGGKYRVVGSEIFETTTKVTINLGTDASSEKATSIEVEAIDSCLPFYTGSIITADGDVNPPVVQ